MFLKKESENKINADTIKGITKKKNTTFRAAFVCLMLCTGLCGILFPLCVTLVAQTMFPYQANGSQITITLADGTQRTFGSEWIGQNYEEPQYMFGRVNLGAPSNLSPESKEYQELLEKRLQEREEKLNRMGLTDSDKIPDELITVSGSGVDPHISPKTAYFQVPIILKARELKGEIISEKEIYQVIEKYTEGKFLYIFGEKRVNVLLVNLSLDGLL